MLTCSLHVYDHSAIARGTQLQRFPASCDIRLRDTRLLAGKTNRNVQLFDRQQLAGSTIMLPVTTPGKEGIRDPSSKAFTAGLGWTGDGVLTSFATFAF